MRILFYGRLADAIDPKVEIDAPDPCPVGELRRLLASTHPAAAEALGRSRACVGSRLVADDYSISKFEQVEFLPPVSGG